MLQFVAIYETVSISVEQLEPLFKFILLVAVFHLAGHQVAELFELERAVSVHVHLVDHISQLRVRRVLSDLPHHCSQLCDRDAAVTIFVEKSEGLAVLGHLLRRHSIHFDFCSYFITFKSEKCMNL